MKWRKNKIVNFIMPVCVLAMLVQIGFGIVWMVYNINDMPGFGDSVEYINLSQSLALDEYRPVLYPLIIRGVIKFADCIGITFHSLLYVIQTAFSFFSTFFLIHTICRILCKQYVVKKYLNWIFEIFLSMYILTIPMITFMNFTVLSDSLAHAALVIFLTEIIILFREEKISAINCIIIILSLISQDLLRADRLYNTFILLVTVFIIKFIKYKKKWKQLFIALFSISLFTIGSVYAVNSFTQTPGLNNRVKTDFNYILLDRIVWPNMVDTYELYPEDIKTVISLEEAQIFDAHNNNVMYQIAPLIEQRVGEDVAGQMYRRIAKIVWDNKKGKVIRDICEDVFATIFTPTSSLLNYYDRCEKNDAWNIYCMSKAHYSLTMAYNSYYLFSFHIMFIVGILITVFSSALKEKRNIGQFLRIISPLIGMSVIFALWFGLGDGHPPNNRYALIVYTTWSLICFVLVGVLEVSKEN